MVCRHDNRSGTFPPLHVGGQQERGSGRHGTPCIFETTAHCDRQSEMIIPSEDITYALPRASRRARCICKRLNRVTRAAGRLRGTARCPLPCSSVFRFNGCLAQFILKRKFSGEGERRRHHLLHTHVPAAPHEIKCIYIYIIKFHHKPCHSQQKGAAAKTVEVEGITVH